MIYLRLVDIDAKRRYNIETKITIPFTNNINMDKLMSIFRNKKLDLDFFLRYKEDLHKYDFGLLISSYLVDQCEGSLTIAKQNEKNNNLESEVGQYS